MDCKISRCEREAVLKGLCRMHYAMIYRPKPDKIQTRLYDLIPSETKDKMIHKRKDPVLCAKCGKKLEYPDIVILNFVKKVCKKCHKELKEKQNEKKD